MVGWTRITAMHDVLLASSLLSKVAVAVVQTCPNREAEVVLIVVGYNDDIARCDYHKSSSC